MNFEPFRSVVLPKDGEPRTSADRSPPRETSAGGPGPSASSSEETEEVWVFADPEDVPAIDSALGRNAPREETVDALPALPERQGPSTPVAARCTTIGPAPRLHPAAEESMTEVVLETVLESVLEVAREAAASPTKEESAPTPRPAPGSSPRRSTSASAEGKGTGRTFAVSYDGEFVGTYQSSRRIQNRTAYQKVAEQLIGRSPHFDPARIRLYRLTEIPNTHPPTVVDAGFSTFSRESNPA
jgi:hypothetical protein